MQQPPPPPPPPPVSPSPPYGSPAPGWNQQPYGSAQGIPPRRRRRWWLWGCGGCAVLVAILLVLGAIGVAFGIHVFTGSPLRQFPTETGAVTVRDTFSINNGHNTEMLVIQDPHPLGAVETFYQSALSSGSWSVQSADPSQARSGDIWQVTNSGASNQRGVVQFIAGSDGSTQVSVQFGT